MNEGYAMIIIGELIFTGHALVTFEIHKIDLIIVVFFTYIPFSVSRLSLENISLSLSAIKLP